MRYLLFILSIITLPDVTPAIPKRIKITVGFYDAINPQLSRELLSAIATQYNAEVSQLPNVQVFPVTTYYKPRNRYRADLILKYINQLPGNQDYFLAVTTHDISTTKGKFYDWGIMGLGYQPGKSCVISTYRLKIANTAIFNDRVIKVALHEIGHNLGLPHYQYSKTCYMEDAVGTVKSVDRETRELCAHCKASLSLYHRL